MLKKLLVAAFVAYSIHSVQAQVRPAPGFVPQGTFLGCAPTPSYCQFMAQNANFKFSFLSQNESCAHSHACYGSAVDPRILGGGQGLKK